MHCEFQEISFIVVHCARHPYISASDSFPRFWRYINLFVCMYMHVLLSRLQCVHYKRQQVLYKNIENDLLSSTILETDIRRASTALSIGVASNAKLSIKINLLPHNIFL